MGCCRLDALPLVCPPVGGAGTSRVRDVARMAARREKKGGGRDGVRGSVAFASASAAERHARSNGLHRPPEMPSEPLPSSPRTETRRPERVDREVVYG